MAWHDQQIALNGLEREVAAEMQRLQDMGVDTGGARTETVDMTTAAGLAEMGVQVRRRDAIV